MSINESGSTSEAALPLALLSGSLRVEVQDVHTDSALAEGSETSDVTGIFVDTHRWGSLALDVLVALGVDAGRLDLFFIDADEMADLNREHMGKDGPTDVLSFPLDEQLEEDDILDVADAAAHGEATDEVQVPIHLGDVVISPRVARIQAPTHAGSLDAEFALLTVHGVLHILGHDHAELAERLTMQALEREFLLGLGFEHPVSA